MAVAAARTATTSRDIAFDIADWAADLRCSDLDPAVIEAVRTNVFDTLSCAVAGSSAAGVGEVAGLARSWGGTPQAAVLVFGDRLPAHHAAWVNGTMAHARDYDDTHDEAVLHAGVSVVPAALAAAGLRGGVSGADFTAAVAAGLEVVCRLGLATTIGLIESGYIYTSLFGYFGATVAAGRVLELTPAEMANAIGIVYSQASGNHQVTRDAALTKRMQPGFAAKAAVLSVQLARTGIRGVQNTFQGEDGFFRVYLRDRCRPEVMTDRLGSRYVFADLSYKPYPSCRFNHTAVDAALAAKAAWNLKADDIRRIEVAVTNQCYEAVCTPVAVRKAPKSIVQAQFSIPYNVAAAILDGRVGLGHFTDESLHRPDLLALTGRIDGVVGAEIERDWSRSISPAALRIETRDGTVLEQRVDYPRGHVRNPMTVEAFDAKLADCMTFAARPLAADMPARLRRAVGELDRLADVSELERVMTAG